MSQRILDIVIASLGIVLLLPVMFIVSALGFFDTGSPIFCQRRVGKNLKPFVLFKFRTMDVRTSSVPSHEVDSKCITSLGSFLRKTKLDELPQLVNVIKGDMSLVGPRPCLFSQQELIDERSKRNVYDVRPGITGLAQVKGIDMSDAVKLSEIDASMINKLDVYFYFSLLIGTVFGKIYRDAARH